MMSKSIISESENSSEVVKRNVAKFSVVSKRAALIPTKFYSNSKKLNKQLDKKRNDCVKDLKVVLHNSKTIQDERNQHDVVKLHNKSLETASNNKILRKYLFDFNTEIGWCQNEIYKNEKEFKKVELKTRNTQNICQNLKELLYIVKPILCNKELVKQNKIRNEMDDALYEVTQKKKLYYSLKSKLSSKMKILYECGGIALQCREERENVINVLKTLRDLHETEDKQRERKIYMTKYKLKIDLDWYEFLRNKCRSRHNRHIKNVNGELGTDRESVDQKENAKNHELKDFIKYLTHISAEKDLKSVMANIDKMNCNKDGLVHLLLYFEEQLANLETTTDEIQSIAIDRMSTKRKKDEFHKHQLKTYLEIICTNKRNIESTRQLIDYLKNTHVEFTERIYGMFLKMKIDTSCNERLFMNNWPTEENVLCYLREIENRLIETLFLVNLTETNLETQDPATSDADSVPNLISKDYHGVEIRPHRLFNMEDPSSLPLSNHSLAADNTPSVCPNCLELDYENVLMNIMTKRVKQNTRTRPLGIFNNDLINQFNFKNIHSKLATSIHNENNCELTHK